MTNGSLVLFTQKEIRFAATLTAFLLFVETVLCEFDKFAFLNQLALHMTLVLQTHPYLNRLSCASK